MLAAEAEVRMENGQDGTWITQTLYESYYELTDPETIAWRCSICCRARNIT